MSHALRILLALALTIPAPAFAQEASAEQPAPEQIDALIDQLVTLDPATIAGKLTEYKTQLTDVETKAAEAKAQAETLEKKATELQQKLESLQTTIGALAKSLMPEAAPEAAMAAAPAPEPAMMAEPAMAAEGQVPEVNFADHIKPIFQQRCFRCHSDDTRKSGLSLMTITSALEGGSSGQVITAGQPDSSRLFRLVSGQEEPKMPPSGDPLTPEELELVKKWIALGAPADASAKVMASAEPAAAEADAVFVAARMDGPPPMPEAPLPAPIPLEQRGVVARAIATSPTAPLAAVGSNRQVLIYNLETLQLMGALPFDEGDIFTLSFSVNGELLVAGGGEEGNSGCAVIWNMRTGERVGKYAEGYDTVLAADISPDHRLLAVGGPNMKVRVHALPDGAELYKLDPHTDWIYSVKFSPDGELLATADRAGGLYLSQATTGRLAENLRGHEGAIHALEFSPDSNILASAGADGTVRMWDSWQYTQIRSISAHGGGVLDVAFALNGELVSTGVDGITKRWAQDGNQILAYEALPDWGYQADLGNGDKFVLAGTWTGEIAVWNRETGERATSLSTNPQAST